MMWFAFVCGFCSGMASMYIIMKDKKKKYKLLERAKKVEELMLIYKQYYNGYLSPADQKRKQDLEKELEAFKK